MKTGAAKILRSGKIYNGQSSQNSFFVFSPYICTHTVPIKVTVEQLFIINKNVLLAFISMSYKMKTNLQRCTMTNIR